MAKDKEIKVKKVDGKAEITSTITEDIVVTKTLVELQQDRDDLIASRDSAAAGFASALAEHDARIVEINQTIVDVEALGIT